MTNWHSYLDETKRGLAKLLARENITVRHATVDTAMFNIQTRELLLPKWKDITVDQYDLLIGHEVGHALYTDRDRLDLLEAAQPYHSYVNVIEDTRIERRIKDAFPGLTGAFTRGYADFFKNGPIFNDVHQRPMDSYTFIDRINIHYKIGAHVRVPFTADELPWLKRIDALRTFEEAVKLAKELFDREKAKPSAKPSETNGSKGHAKATSSPSSNGTGSGDDAGEQPTPNENAQNGDKPSDAKDGSEASQGAADPSPNASTPNGDPVAETDLSNASALKSMASPDDNDPIMLTYATVSPAQMAAQIVTSDRVLTKWQSAYRADQRQPAVTIREKFNTQYGPVIAHMAREFERRKTAKLMERARVSRSGRLDTTKLASYKFREDLFKQVMSLPQGKSHGIVVLIDGSGSMSPVFSDTLEQALVLGQFAKKVNVPFKALMFTSHYAYDQTPYGYKPESLMPDRSCRLVTLLDTAAPNWAMQEEVVCAAANAYTARSSERTCPVPPYFSLGQTPLYSGMLMVEPILDQMKSQYRLDKTTLFILTDGEDSNNVAYVDATGQENARLNRFGAKNRGIIVRDARTRKTYGRVVETTQYDYHSGKDVPALLNTMNAIPEMLVEMIRDRHQTRVMLIRLLDRRSLRRMKSATSEVADTLTSLLRVPFASNENFARRSEILTAAQLTAIATALTGKDSTGQTLVPASATYYDAVLLVNPSTLDLDEDDFDDLVTDGMSAKRIASAFTKSNVTAARNKVFVNAVIPHLI